MTNFSVYLFFNGNCAEAMSYYKTCFGEELSIIQVKDSPAKDSMPRDAQDKVVNARLIRGVIDISASDWLRSDRTTKQGNTVCLYISDADYPELKGFFDKLKEGADTVDPLTEEFFGTYGALTDKYGVRWMFHGTK